MIRRAGQIARLGLIETVTGPLRDGGIPGLIITTILNLMTTLVPFLLFFFGVFGENWGIIWYLHVALMFELIVCMLSGQTDLTSYTSLRQFPLSASGVLGLRFFRRFSSPISIISTGLYIAAVILAAEHASVLMIAELCILTIALFLFCELAELWREKCGNRNLVNYILVLTVLFFAVAPFPMKNGVWSPIVMLYTWVYQQDRKAYLCLAVLAAGILCYYVLARVPDQALRKFSTKKQEHSSKNLVLWLISKLPIRQNLKQLIIKDYKVMLRNNIALILQVAIWVLLSWFLSRGQNEMPLLRNEWIALAFAGAIIQIYSVILQRPFAGDSYSVWVTLLSPVPRRLILISKNIVVLLADLWFFVLMSIFAYIVSPDFTASKCAAWLLLYLCYAVIMALLLNRSLVSRKIKRVHTGKRNLLASAVSFIGKMLFYVLIVASALFYQILLDSKYSRAAFLISIPALIILIFIYAMSLEGQVKYINRYTQSITEQLVLS